MHDRVRRVRAQISRLQRGKPPTAVRYPATVRREVIAIARRRQVAGEDVGTVAREVGVARWTLALWLRRPSSPTLRAVAVEADDERDAAGPVQRVVLITPHGVRVEGLDPATLTAVLRALG